MWDAQYHEQNNVRGCQLSFWRQSLISDQRLRQPAPPRSDEGSGEGNRRGMALVDEADVFYRPVGYPGAPKDLIDGDGAEGAGVA